MEFTRDTRLDCWKTTAVLGERELTVHLPTWFEGSARVEVVTEALRRVEARWVALRDCQLSSLYAGHAHDPGEGRPVLEPEAFLAALVPYHLEIMEDDQGISLSLLFSDSGVFGGHTVVVDLEPGEGIGVSLFG